MSRLILIIVATCLLAVAPAVPGSGNGRGHIQLIGLVAAALFLLAFLYELRLLRTRPEQQWYDGRAVAESTKTLAWRFAVGGNPYPINIDAQSILANDVLQLGTDLPQLHKEIANGGGATHWMLALRGSTFATRKAAYLTHRVKDQEDWYRRKAEFNRGRARMWSQILLVSEALGVAFALIQASGLVAFDLASFAGVLSTFGIAWLAFRQHETVGAAYQLASLELGSVFRQLECIENEDQWASAVSNAEEAVSREHTMWRVSRAKPESAGQ